MIKVSIVTVVYNGDKFLEQTILSVLNQTYKNIEYIIIDGGSTDKTVEIIKKYENSLACWVSEKDRGIYDAMNKGVLKATGELVGIINSDDFYSETTSVENIVAAYQNNCTPDILYGNIKFFNPETNQTKVIYPSVLNLNKDMTLNHPSCFLRVDLYKSKLFDINFKICADYDLILFFYLNGKKLLYVDKMITTMRIGGASDNFKLSTKEVFMVQKKHFSTLLASKNYIIRHVKRLLKNILLIGVSGKKIESMKGFSK
jgi:glycosyltransferase involved in cell wall biosynthesis